MTVDALQAPAHLGDAKPARPAKRALPGRAFIALGVAAVLAIGGYVFLRLAHTVETTDNAYLKSDRTIVAPKVRGLIAEILVADNQRVAAGQPLIRLDDEEYAARLSGAQADVATADAALASAEAALKALDSDEALAQSSIGEAETGIRAADADATYRGQERTRYETLATAGTAPVRSAEQARAASLAANAAADKSRAALNVAHRQMDVVAARRAQLLAAVAQARAGKLKADAALNLARQDSGHAIIRAPMAGIVGDRQAEVGEYVQPGTRLLTVVPTDRLYLVANFKETQTARMVVGQAVTIKVDALPGQKLTGHVQSFAPGSGSEFALLPFEPGTGNFTKIVQRVPVRIALDPNQPAVKRLRPGLSAKVSVRVGG
ncbi:MAG: Transporter [Caulobacter sp.]|nr:Transporter [Caulobacter sp.]